MGKFQAMGKFKTVSRFLQSVIAVTLVIQLKKEYSFSSSSSTTTINVVGVDGDGRGLVVGGLEGASTMTENNKNINDQQLHKPPQPQEEQPRSLVTNQNSETLQVLTANAAAAATGKVGATTDLPQANGSNHLRGHEAAPPQSSSSSSTNVVVANKTSVAAAAVTAVAKARHELGTKLSAVLVEIRCHKGILIVLQAAMKHLLAYDIQLVVWHSSENEKYLQSLIDADPILKKAYYNEEQKLLHLHKFDPLDYGFDDSKDHQKVRYNGEYWYQRLIKDWKFWDSMVTEWVVNLQSDTIICQSPEVLQAQPIGPLERISYLGARSAFGKIPIDPTNYTMRRWAHLNGGFSLHSVAWTKDCIEMFTTRGDNATLQVYEQKTEDDFWQTCRPKSKLTTDVTDLMAYAFSSDNGASNCFYVPKTNQTQRLCPFGVHKPWRRKKEHNGTYYKELVENCPGLDKLEVSQDRFAVGTENCDVLDIDGKTITVPCQCGM